MAKEFVSSIKKNWLALLIVFSFTLIAAGWFYWFQWRPASIRRECFKLSTWDEDLDMSLEKVTLSFGYEINRKVQEIINDRYENCLRKYGLKD